MYEPTSIANEQPHRILPRPPIPSPLLRLRRALAVHNVWVAAELALELALALAA